MNYEIRPARFDEIESLNEIIQRSAQALSQGEYSSAQIAGLIQYVFGVDQELVADKTYYVILKDKEYMACGGWSCRRTLFGGDQCVARESGYLDPKADAAKIRAFFVHPQYARQGLGRALLLHCEEEARKKGFSRAELMATLPGVKLYAACGYKADTIINYGLPNGLSVKFVPMKKDL